MTLEEVYLLRDYFVEVELGIEFYTYQTKVSNKILKALLFRTGDDIPVEITRQAGKTESLVCTLCFLMTASKFLTKNFWGYEAGIRIIIFSPQKEQVKTDFDRLKSYLNRLKNNGWSDLIDSRESNQTTLQLINGSSCYIFPLTPTSNPESKSADLLIFEEAHKIIDTEKHNKADPMGASTNAPSISFGVAWYQKNYFKNLIDSTKEHLRFDAYDVIKIRRKRFEETGDLRHLLYEKHFKKKEETLGLDDVSVQTQYLLKWKLEAGQFMLAEDWEEMTVPYIYIDSAGKKKNTVAQLLDEDRKSECYAGIDTAKHPDSTVVTVIRWNAETKHKELIALLELHGTNYSEQFTIISGYDTVAGRQTGQGMFDAFNIVGVAIDSTGQGSFMPDFFKTHTRWQDDESGLFEVKFSMVSKDAIYTTLMQSMTNRLTAIPPENTVELVKMRKQLLDLQKEYKGQFLSCHHPNDESGNEFHDDYPDSFALAEYAFSQQRRIAIPKIRSL